MKSSKNYLTLLTFVAIAISCGLYMLAAKEKNTPTSNGQKIFANFLLEQLPSNYISEPFSNSREPNLPENNDWRWKKIREISLNRKILDELVKSQPANAFVPRQPKYAITISDNECIVISEVGPTLANWSYHEDGIDFVLDDLLKTFDNADLWRILLNLIKISRNK